jgi:hypothetical protein
MWKKIFLGLLLTFIVIQFFRPAKNLSSKASAQDITTKYPTTAEVRHVLEVACFDCHSNNTRYPWYAEIQPTAWWLASHVEDGKKHLNFSEFGSLTDKRATRKLQQMIDELTDKTMPLPSYRWGHKDARLTDAQIQLLTDWAESVREKISPSDDKSADDKK